LHQVDRTGVDREVHHHAAAGSGGDQRREHVAIVVAGEAVVNEADLALVEQPAIAVVRCDDGELVAVEREVALDQRQRTAADRTEAAHHDRAVEARVQLTAVARAVRRVHVDRSCSTSRGGHGCAWSTGTYGMMTAARWGIVTRGVAFTGEFSAVATYVVAM